MGEMKTILAMAVGPKKDQPISAKGNLSGVRPYIEGLIEGLAKLNRDIGTDYEIDYRERELQDLESKQHAADAFKANSELQNDLIFGMSTTVVRAAQGVTKSIPIVGVVSEHKAEGFTRGGNITGISARRSQTAGACFERFLATVPTLKTVRVLHRPGYGPSDRALKLVKAAGKKRGVTVTAVPIKSRQDIEKKLSALSKRDLRKPADMGLFVNPVDVFFSAAPLIIDLAQVRKNVPTFFTIPDRVRPKLPSALGAHGVSQRKCGELMAEFVDQILWHGVSPKTLKVKEADDDAFEWVVSSDAARALNIKIPRVI